MAEMKSKKRLVPRVIIALSALISVGVAARFFVVWRGVSYPEYELDFGNNQKTTLRMHRRGEKMTGTLKVAPPKVSFQAFGFQLVHHAFGSVRRFKQAIPAGEYEMEGLFMEPRSYRLVGRFPQPLSEFAIGGELPDATKPGNYVLVAAGAVANGDLPAFDGTLPAPKNSPANSTSAYADCKIGGTLKKSPDVNTNASQFDIGLHYGHLPVKRSGLWVGSYIQSDGKATQQIVFNIEAAENAILRVGQEFSFKKGSGNSLTYSEYGGQNKDWDSVDGTIKIQSVSKGEITFVASDVQLKARSGSEARGTMTLGAKGKMQATPLPSGML